MSFLLVCPNCSCTEFSQTVCRFDSFTVLMTVSDDWHPTFLRQISIRHSWIERLVWSWPTVGVFPCQILGIFHFSVFEVFSSKL